MAYAAVADIKGRAGVLGAAWDLTTTPGDAEIQALIDQADATLDLAFAGHGFDHPQTDPVVTAALEPIVADLVLLQLIPMTWPAGNAGADAQLAQIRERVEGKNGQGGYLAGLADGSIDVLRYLAQANQGDATGADNFWSKEPGYSSSLDDLQTGAIRLTGAGIVLRSPTGPAIHKDTRL